MRTTINHQTLTEIFNVDTRLDSKKLYEMLLSFAQMAMLHNNRCALISGIASMLNNIQGDDVGIKDFISLQIDRETDCGLCDKCDASHTASNA